MTNGEFPAIANQSEISSAFLVCGLWAGLVALLPRTATTEQRAAIWGLWLVTGGWVLWCTVAWGGLGAKLPLLNLVPAPRAAQTAGFSAALLLCLVLSRAHRITPGIGLAVAGWCGLLTAYGVTSLRAALPTLSPTEVWVTSLVVVACVWAVTVFPHRWQSVLGVSLVLLWSGYQVNPVILGLGDLRDSDAAVAARGLGERARAAGEYIASDDPFVSALLVGNGAPSVTGWQITGPREESWLLLDTDREYEDAWNRGASTSHGLRWGARGRSRHQQPEPRHRPGRRRPLRHPRRGRHRGAGVHRGAGTALPVPRADLQVVRGPALRLRGRALRLSSTDRRRCPTVHRHRHIIATTASTAPTISTR